jgi:hypothetical protein
MAVTDIDNNARSNAAAGSYGGPLFLYKLACNGIQTDPTLKDSNLSKILAFMSQRTTVLSWAPGGNNVAYALCEGGIDLEAWPQGVGTGATSTAGTIDLGDTGASADCAITKHVVFA